MREPNRDEHGTIRPTVVPFSWQVIPGGKAQTADGDPVDLVTLVMHTVHGAQVFTAAAPDMAPLADALTNACHSGIEVARDMPADPFVGPNRAQRRHG